MSAPTESLRYRVDVRVGEIQSFTAHLASEEEMISILRVLRAAGVPDESIQLTRRVTCAIWPFEAETPCVEVIRFGAGPFEEES